MRVPPHHIGFGFVAPIVAILLLACATTHSPRSTFDAYRDAYADGDAAQMWALSSAKARSDVSRLRAELLIGLESTDTARRFLAEGQLALTAAQVRAMSDYALYRWAVGAIRKRLNAAVIRRLASQMRFVREIATVNGAEVIYRNGAGAESRMVLSRSPNEKGWRVDFSPFEDNRPSP
jgi:hypothetical protein